MFYMFSFLFSKWCLERPGLGLTVRQVLDSISHQPPNRPQFEGETSQHLFVTYTSVVIMEVVHKERLSTYRLGLPRTFGVSIDILLICSDYLSGVIVGSL